MVAIQTMATKKQPPAPTTPEVSSLVFFRPYSFFDDNGRHRAWQPGHVVNDPADIALLIARKAPVEHK
jgi:hypothetical protein